MSKPFVSESHIINTGRLLQLFIICQSWNPCQMQQTIVHLRCFALLGCFAGSLVLICVYTHLEKTDCTISSSWKPLKSTRTWHSHQTALIPMIMSRHKLSFLEWSHFAIGGGKHWSKTKNPINQKRFLYAAPVSLVWPRLSWSRLHVMAINAQISQYQQLSWSSVRCD